jgi:hypothetical protein
MGHRVFLSASVASVRFECIPVHNTTETITTRNAQRIYWTMVSVDETDTKVSMDIARELAHPQREWRI